jgi:two-component system chemotaxis response regulator CheY
MPDQNMKTCLVVDDSKVVRMVARKILEELGFEVAEAEDGQVALDMSMESMPDVVLLDWNMPVMSDIEYLRALRVTDDSKKPVVVFCTTENDMSHIQEGISAGANEYIMKSFDSDIIQSKFVQTGLL